MGPNVCQRAMEIVFVLGCCLCIFERMNFYDSQMVLNVIVLNRTKKKNERKVNCCCLWPMSVYISVYGDVLSDGRGEGVVY